MSTCTEYACDGIVHAKGLCDKHYNRLLKYGRLEKTHDWGDRRKHPLYDSWRTMNRKKDHHINVDIRWKDFWKFVEDVGERPSENHILKRRNELLPYSKENTEWKEKVILREKTEDKKEYMRRYAREHRISNPDHYRNLRLIKTFGINLEEYNEMLISQNNGCAICGEAPPTEEKTERKFAHLPVDHCHTTGKVRGLLCHRCNRGIGFLGDSIPYLKNAILYLQKHQSQ